MAPHPLKFMRIMRTVLKKGMFHCNLQVHYRCNFRCAICDFWREPRRSTPRLELSQVRFIAQKIRPLGPLSLCVSGGEPLLHPEIMDINAALAHEHFLVLITNGWFVTPENARELFRTGIYEADVSIDYADPARHDRERGMPGAFDRAVAALETLRANRHRKEQRVHMMSVVLPDNLDDIEKLAALCRKIGVTQLISFYSAGRGARQEERDARETARRLLDIKKRYREFVALPGYIERFAQAGPDGRGIPDCRAGRNLFVIDCQGNLTRCLDKLDRPAGNIFTDGLEDLMQALGRQQAEYPCSDCWTSCRGNVETLFYGEKRLENWRALYEMTKPLPLRRVIKI